MRCAKFCYKGKVEVELFLMNLEEAEKNPAGEGHKEPDALAAPK